MKKVLIAVSIVLIVFLLGGFFAYRYYMDIEENPLVLDEDITVEVSENDSFYGVLEDLDSKGYLKNLILTKVHLTVNPLDTNLKPGTFKVEKNSSLVELVEALRDGEDINKVTITIPEGFTIEKIAELFEEKGLFTKEDFIKAAEDYPIPNWILDSEYRRYAMEGFLKPDTYDFKIGRDADYIVDFLYKSFVKEMENIIADQSIELNTSLWNRVITIASMIEREAANNEEMRTVSSVIHNRIDIRMPLQIDATVVYALGLDMKDKVYLKDLEVDSPYNTYKINSLPIGPIANPGTQAIKAALNPETTDYIYYVLDKQNKKHFFTNSYDEFLVKKKEFAN